MGIAPSNLGGLTAEDGCSPTKKEFNKQRNLLVKRGCSNICTFFLVSGWWDIQRYPLFGQTLYVNGNIIRQFWRIKLDASTSQCLRSNVAFSWGEVKINPGILKMQSYTFPTSDMFHHFPRIVPPAAFHAEVPRARASPVPLNRWTAV